MEKKVKVKVLGSYNGHSVKVNKNVDLGFKCPYDQIIDYIQLLQFLSVDVAVKVKMNDGEVLSLGTFRVKGLGVDHDGEGKLQFTSMADFVEMDNINVLVGTDVLKLMFSATIETESDEETE